MKNKAKLQYRQPKGIRVVGITKAVYSVITLYLSLSENDLYTPRYKEQNRGEKKRSHCSVRVEISWWLNLQDKKRKG